MRNDELLSWINAYPSPTDPIQRNSDTIVYQTVHVHGISMVYYAHKKQRCNDPASSQNAFSWWS